MKNAVQKTTLDQSDLTHARRIAATLVETFGDDYWPAFECIDRELESRRGRQDRLRNAFAANG